MDQEKKNKDSKKGEPGNRSNVKTWKRIARVNLENSRNVMQQDVDVGFNVL